MVSLLLVVLIMAVTFGIVLGKWWAWALLILIAVATIWSLVDKHQKEKQIAIDRSNEYVKKDMRLKEYLSIMEKLGIPANLPVLTVLESNDTRLFSSEVQYYIWKENDSLKFFPTEPTIKNYHKYNCIDVTLMPIESIEYFTQTGEIFRETKISGGGGGGSSIGGAVVGGMIAGDAGAVIGSRQKTSDIKSETITHDTRETVLSYFAGGNRVTVHFAYADFIILNDLIPKKEKSIVDSINANKIISESLNKDCAENIIDAVQSLASLKESGILSEYEFKEKKKVLLEKLK